jgi:hypothetical protein
LYLTGLAHAPTPGSGGWHLGAKTLASSYNIITDNVLDLSKKENDIFYNTGLSEKCNMK